MTDESIAKTINYILVDQLGVEEDKITPDAILK